MLSKEEGSSPVSLQLLRGRIFVFLAWVLCSPTSICVVFVVVKSSLKQAREECESKRAYVFLVHDV